MEAAIIVSSSHTPNSFDRPEPVLLDLLVVVLVNSQLTTLDAPFPYESGIGPPLFVLAAIHHTFVVIRFQDTNFAV